MSFDLTAYLKQQVMQQHPLFLANEDSNQRQQYLVHLVALQLHLLAQTDQTECLTQIQHQQVDWLNRLCITHIETHPLSQQYFQTVQAKLTSASQTVAQITMIELAQLEQISNLGVAGIQELLQNQYELMAQYVDDWFLADIERNDLITTSYTGEQNNVADFNQVMQEFNQMLQQQIHHGTQGQHDGHHQRTPDPIVAAVATLYKVLNPCIALFIICYVFHFIF